MASRSRVVRQQRSSSSTTKKVSYQTSTPMTQTTRTIKDFVSFSSPGRRSPGCFNEKKEMISLNDRLAAFIDQVNTLKQENTRLELEISSLRESRQDEWTEVSGMLEGKLDTERGLRADALAEAERLRIENKKYKSEATDLRPRVKKLEQELDEAMERVGYFKALIIPNVVKKLEQELGEAMERVGHFEAQLIPKDRRIHTLEEELKKLRKELGLKDKELKDVTKQVETLRVTRVTLEERVRELEAQLEEKEQYNQALFSARLTSSSTAGSANGEYEGEFGSISLYKELVRARQEDLAGDIELSDLSNIAGYLQKVSVEEFTIELDKLRRQLAVKDQNDELIARIMELENQLRQERESHLMAIRSRETELHELRGSVEVHIRNYEELMNVKLNLDREIATYRVLLEGGEASFNLESQSSMLEGRSRGIKRKRGLVEDEYRVVRSSTSNGIISIVDTDPEGNFLRLQNASDQTQTIGGWQLKRIVDGDEFASYKFGKKVVLGQDDEVTVWASGSDGKVDDAPSDLVSKNTESWGSGESVETRLIDASGDLVASCKETKELINTGNGSGNASCSIM